MKEVKPETEMEVGYILSGGGLLSSEDRWCLEEAGALTGMMEAKLAVAASSRADHLHLNLFLHDRPSAKFTCCSICSTELQRQFVPPARRIHGACNPAFWQRRR